MSKKAVSPGGRSSADEMKVRTLALEVTKVHAVSYATAYGIVSRVYGEAEASIFKMVREYGAAKWRNLPFKDKAAITTTLFKGLLNKKTLTEFMNSERSGLI